MQEEQRVIEAKIRIRQQELHDEEERMQNRQISSSRNMAPIGDEYGSVTGILSLRLWFLLVYKYPFIYIMKRASSGSSIFHFSCGRGGDCFLS